MVDDGETRMQEALFVQALAALQLHEEDNDNVDAGVTTINDDDTNDSEFLLSLENIEPQPLVEDLDIHYNENDENGSSDPLSILSPEIIALLSIDNDGDDDGTNYYATNDIAAQKEEQTYSLAIEKETVVDNNNTDLSTPNTTTVTADSLPDIEIDFGDDSFLVDPNQLYSVFDEDFNKDGTRNNDSDVFLEEEEVGDNIENNEDVHDELVDQFYPSLSGQEQEDLFDNPIDLETEELLKELANMSLFGDTNDTTSSHSAIDNSDNININSNDNSNDASNESAANAIVAGEDLLMDPSYYSQMEVTGTDGLPFYLVCQPCGDDNDGNDANGMGNGNHNGTYGGEDQFHSLNHNLPPITEDLPLNDHNDYATDVRDLRELYLASSKQELIPLDHSDPLLKELEAQIDDTEDEDDIQLEHYPEEDETTRNVAKHWTEAFGIKLDESTIPVRNNAPPKPSKDTSKLCYGHKETIYGVSFSEDGKYVATASQDATICIWNASTNRLLATLKGHDIKYECLRVDWASSVWADEILDRSARFANLLASSAADGTIKLWSCEGSKDGDQRMSKWKCEYTMDHAALLSQGTKSDSREGEEKSGENINEEASSEVENNKDDGGDKPQVYSLQFIDHWKIFTKELHQHQCQHHPQQDQEQQQASNNDCDDKNSFLMTSSDEFIHLWEVPGHPYDQQLKSGDHKIRILQEDIKLKEVMSLHFGPLDQYGFGVTACSITGTVQLPSPPKVEQSIDDDEIFFGGERNPTNTIFVFDASYCPASGLLGVALADGSLRLVNGRGECISVINLPGNRSHLTSFCWSSCGTRLATCAATGHL